MIRNRTLGWTLVGIAGLAVAACQAPPAASTPVAPATASVGAPVGGPVVSPPGTPSSTVGGTVASSAPLPPPHTLPPDVYERRLYQFLDARGYLFWAHDKRVRDTGPLIDGAYYGTHAAARVYYSPEALAWLTAGRQGSIPDGAMLIKEMFPPPAARYPGAGPDDLSGPFNGWATMVRDHTLAKDGWYWSYYGPGQKVDSHQYPFDYPNSGTGQYCARCHASAAEAFTFASLDNVAGFPGDPLQFRVDNSWLATPTAQPGPTASAELQAHAALADGPDVAALGQAKPVRGLNADFARTFAEIAPVSSADVVPIPPVTYDHVVVGPDGPRQFVTSDQCLGCHDGQGKPFGPNMLIPAAAGHKPVNVSPYGEWNWSMMGLAGRDPIFYAQLESERRFHPSQAVTVTDLCLSCHGVMGQRQSHLDHPGQPYRLESVFATDLHDPASQYGALSRDGISCTVCHQMVDDGPPLDQVDTGRFVLSTPGAGLPGISDIFGPFADPVTRPMSVTLAMRPVQSDYLKDARLCGTCHTVHLPVYDRVGKQVGTFYEQATYPEWQNSAYQNELAGGGATPQTCQDCHMPSRYPATPDGQPLAFRIANIQDQTYPDSEHHAPTDEITLAIRDGFARHTLQGINQFALEMFNQYDDILGVRKTDYMTSSPDGLQDAIANGYQLASRQTAVVAVSDVSFTAGRVHATVKVTNLAGHRLPSGVGFRRAFVELDLLDEQENVVWASGRTDSTGVIVDADGQPLATEYFTPDPKTGQQNYQPHYQTITRPDQVQIYEEVVRDPEGQITNSFVALAKVLKDNRLLPKGWTAHGPPGFTLSEATAPEGEAAKDPDFTDGTGSDTLSYDIAVPAGYRPGSVVATLYYEATPPSFLRDRFSTAPDGPQTQRLHYLASHLNLADTHIQDWKLAVASATTPVAFEKPYGRPTGRPSAPKWSPILIFRPNQACSATPEAASPAQTSTRGQ